MLIDAKRYLALLLLRVRVTLRSVSLVRSGESRGLSRYQADLSVQKLLARRYRS
jgi:hypothetical protein